MIYMTEDHELFGGDSVSNNQKDIIFVFPDQQEAESGKFFMSSHETMNCTIRPDISISDLYDFSLDDKFRIERISLSNPREIISAKTYIDEEVVVVGSSAKEFIDLTISARDLGSFMAFVFSSLFAMNFISDVVIINSMVAIVGILTGLTFWLMDFSSRRKKHAPGG